MLHVNYRAFGFKGWPRKGRPPSSKPAGTLESDQTLTGCRRWKHGLCLPASSHSQIHTNMWYVLGCIICSIFLYSLSHTWPFYSPVNILEWSWDTTFTFTSQCCAQRLVCVCHVCVFADMCACCFGGFVSWRAAALFSQSAAFDLNPRFVGFTVGHEDEGLHVPRPFNSRA